jgi:hypothetical protein
MKKQQNTGATRVPAIVATAIALVVTALTLASGPATGATTTAATPVPSITAYDYPDAAERARSAQEYARSLRPNGLSDLHDRHTPAELAALFNR